MADTTNKNVQSRDYKVVHVGGSAVVATGTGGVTSSNILGAVVARSNTGTFTVTMQDTWPELLGAHITVSKATAQDLVPQITSLSGKVLTFKLLTGTTATDVTSEAATLYISLFFKNSTIAP